MSELISGRDAWIAYFDGEIIEFNNKLDDKWYEFDLEDWKPDELKGEHYLFRIKSKTIKIELEIPAHFEPKNGEWYFFLVAENICGYSTDKFEGVERDFHQIQFGAWRTEDEIKKVVAALRSIKK